MKTYSVKEVAELLNTNPETVRRWIRNGKLKSNIDSRKGGNVISQQMLDNFLKNSPKYAGIAAASLLIPPIGMMTATVLGSAIVNQQMKGNKATNATINSSDVIKILKSDIQSREDSIQRKQDTIDHLLLEIQEETQRIEEAKQLLSKLETTENNL